MASSEFDFGKDHVVLMNHADAEIKSTYELPEQDPDNNEPIGVIQPNGDINWDCPCLGGMASGPCALEFQDAFSCFHYSTSEAKGAECLGAFQAMQACIANYPNLYPMKNDSNEDPLSQALQESDEAASSGAGGDGSDTQQQQQQQQQQRQHLLTGSTSQLSSLDADSDTSSGGGGREDRLSDATSNTKNSGTA